MNRRKLLFWLCIGIVTVVSRSAFAQQSQAREAWPSPGLSIGEGTPLAKANLIANDLKAIRAVTAEEIDDFCDTRDEEKSAQRRRIFRNLLVNKLQLTSSGPKMILVRGRAGDWKSGGCLCGGSGANCKMWIIRVSGNTGTVLWEDMGWGPTILESQAHGYFDLKTSGHLGGGESSLIVWRFDGEQYRPFRCATLEDSTGLISEYACRE